VKNFHRLLEIQLFRYRVDTIACTSAHDSYVVMGIPARQYVFCSAGSDWRRRSWWRPATLVSPPSSAATAVAHAFCGGGKRA